MDTVTLLALVQIIVLIVTVGLALYTARDSKKKIQVEANKVLAETRRADAEYWKLIAEDLRPRVVILEKQDRRKTVELKQIHDAFDFICEAVKATHPKSVEIAQRIAAGKQFGGEDDDVTEAHE